MLSVLKKNRQALRAGSKVWLRANSGLAAQTSPTLIEELRHLSLKHAAQKPLKSEDRHSKLLGNTFSSRRDGVFRQKNSDSISRIWSLLDVFLEAKNFPRAEAMLHTLKPLVLEDNLPLVDDLNKYFRKYAETASLEELDSLWRTWPSKFDVQPNAKTFAILANRALDLNEDPSQFIEQYEENDRSARDIFAYIDVFGVKNLTRLIADFNYDIELIPHQYRHFVDEIQNPEPELEEFQEEFPPSLQKAVGDLRPVDTFGMKAIRRTLLAMGPELNEQFIQNLDEELVTKLNFLNSDKSSDINFFKIYQSLPVELQDKFEQALDDFNQERQRELENNAVAAAQERWKHDYEELKAQGTLSLSRTLNSTLWKWSQDLTPLVEEEIKLCKKINTLDTIPKELMSKVKDKIPYAQYFTLLPANKIAAITILELLKMHSTGGVNEGMRITSAVMSVANALELEYRSEQVKKSERAVFKDLKNPADLKKYAKSLSYFQSDKLLEWNLHWPSEVKAKIGSLLVSMLMHVSQVPVEAVDPVTKKTVHGEAPAFYHSYQYQGSIKVGVLKLHKSIAAQLSGDRLNGAVQPQLLPMLVRARPWTSWNSGGYLYSQGFIIRTKDSPEQTAYLKASSDKLGKVYDGLNVLGSTAWTVNERVFNVMSTVWNTGEAFLDIPRLQEDLNLPPAPKKNAEPSVIFAWKNEVKKLQNEFNNNRSTRCDSNYKLEIARAFLGEKMYFPHNLDFRGRAYPLSPNFNHLGNDLSRGLLLFWKGKPLGEDGLRWLKVHLSNLFGIDKAPLTERVAYAEENVDKIFKTAADPLGYQDWWTKADKPWQALATIFELSEALKLDDPTKYVSHQPVHQDGTCNGLQHYAALGGDMEGAKQVNLTPAERPQDVYTFVADLVKERLETLAVTKGDPMAMVLKDKIKRKIVKQTVMTNVYGVTYVGATAQIDKQLADVFPGEDTYKYSLYLTKHVFACIRELFEGAHLIQDWLATCARLISHSVRIDMDAGEVIGSGEKPPHMASTIWTTPLGLPIVQPYRSVERRQVATNLQTIYIKDPFAMNPVDARKQVAAFPPNFIHSLDATHMLLSAIACSKAGLEFAAVHDSYWTHASDVNTMNACLRDEFIKLHEVDLIAQLKNEFDERYKGFLRLVRIPRASDMAKKVTEHRKMISQQLGRRVTLGDEIYLERKRQLLLNSEDPEQQERGREVVTTVSLLENVDVDALLPEQKKRVKSVEEDVVDEGRPAYVKVLAPLRLPEIPLKGDYDVQELRRSQYFFS